MNKDIYVTINHLMDYNAEYSFRVGDVLLLMKDRDNCYDDEAIAVYSKHGEKCGYVANSVCTVARGTYSAGRIYDLIGDEQEIRICFILEDCMIAKI